MPIAQLTPTLETIACLLCGGVHFRQLQQAPDYALGLPGSFALARCRACGLLYQNPRPPLAEIEHYYPPSYRRTARTSQQLQRRLRRRCQLLDRLVVAQPGQPRRLLDVGSGAGQFLDAMRAYPGWQVEGLELQAALAHASAMRLGVPVLAGPLEHARYPAACFDAVTLWDVLEHLHNPLASLVRLRHMLRPGGVLCLCVPNAASYVARLSGRYWSGYDLPRHMTAFTPRTLTQALARAGFDRLLYRGWSGSYSAALQSLAAASAHGWLAGRAATLVRWLRHPLARGLAWPPFQLADRLFGGSNLELLVRAGQP